jgi:hypothetical protein
MLLCRHVQQKVEVNIDKPGDVFRPFNITTHPVD